MPYKELVVGDPHVTVDELQDCHALLALIQEVAEKNEVEVITILGDLFHNHALINVRVMEFWDKALTALPVFTVPPVGRDSGKVIVLVGNHDMPGDDTYPHSLIPFKDKEGVIVVDSPVAFRNKAYLPYYAEPNLFVEDATEFRQMGCKTLICHQEFQGAKYENGFYTPNGVDPEALDYPLVLSGHIHTPQRFGNVWYPGAPRWRTRSDADIERSIWVLTYADDGVLLDSTPVSTGDGCRRIRSLVVTPEQPEFSANENELLYVTVEGPQEFVTDYETKIRDAVPSARVNTIITDSVRVKVRESDGIPVAYRKYVESYTPKYGTDPAMLSKLAQERLYGEA